MSRAGRRLRRKPGRVQDGGGNSPGNHVVLSGRFHFSRQMCLLLSYAAAAKRTRLYSELFSNCSILDRDNVFSKSCDVFWTVLHGVIIDWNSLILHPSFTSFYLPFIEKKKVCFHYFFSYLVFSKNFHGKHVDQNPSCIHRTEHVINDDFMMGNSIFHGFRHVCAPLFNSLCLPPPLETL